MKRGWQIYLMLLPVMVFYILFSYVPMNGIVLAWKEYLPKQGIWGSPGVGWKYFEQFFTRPSMFWALKNTIVISLLKLVFCFPAPIFLAILLNEVHSQRYRKTLQWMVYLPYFISWVVIGGIVKQLLAVDDLGFSITSLRAWEKTGWLSCKIPLIFIRSSSSPNCGRAWGGVRSST